MLTGTTQRGSGFALTAAGLGAEGGTISVPCDMRRRASRICRADSGRRRGFRSSIRSTSAHSSGGRPWTSVASAGAGPASWRVNSSDTLEPSHSTRPLMHSHSITPSA